MESGSRGANKKYPAKPNHHDKNFRPGFYLFGYNCGNNSVSRTVRFPFQIELLESKDYIFIFVLSPASSTGKADVAM